MAVFLTSGRSHQRATDRVAEFSATGNRARTLLLVLGLLAGAWVATYLAGGSRTAVPHAFYLPLVLAALRFGCRGALTMTVVTGIAAGPLMPLDVAAGTVQAVPNWGTRMAAFGAVSCMVLYFRQETRPSILERTEGRRFRAELRRAIDTGAIRPAYQPIVDLTTGRLIGLEALARWHTDDGTISPDEFVTKAERWGCVDQLTSHMLRQACLQVAAWRNDLLAGHDWFKLAVNISAQDIARDDFADEVNHVLRTTDIPRDWLHLELTETALLSDVDHTIDQLMHLRMLGVRLVIDDFGTGESSLAYLRRFPVDAFKIDKAFTSQLEHHHRSTALMDGIVAMGTRMGLATVVEGIETPHQARLARSFGAAYGQGYLFAPPAPAPDIEIVLDALDLFEERTYLHLNPPSWARQETLW